MRRKYGLVEELLARFDNKRVWRLPDSAEDGKIKVKQIRDLAEELSLSVDSQAYRLIILDKVDELDLGTGNSLLKILEEPPTRTVFILLAERRESILKTILSRCRVSTLRVEPIKLSTSDLGYNDLLATRSSLTDSEIKKQYERYKKIVEWLVSPLEYRLSQVKELSEEDLDLAEGYLHQQLFSDVTRKEWAYKGLSAIRQARELIKFHSSTTSAWSLVGLSLG